MNQLKRTVLSFSLISILLFTNLSLLYSIQSAEAQRFVSFNFKVIPKFTSGKTKTELTDTMTLTMPKLEQHVRDRLEKDFPNFKVDVVLGIAKDDSGSYEIYPKIVVSGDTDQKGDILLLEYDSAVDDIMTTLLTDLELAGLTDITWHVHKSFGAIDIGLPTPKVQKVKA